MNPSFGARSKLADFASVAAEVFHCLKVITCRITQTKILVKLVAGSYGTIAKPIQSATSR